MLEIITIDVIKKSERLKDFVVQPRETSLKINRCQRAYRAVCVCVAVTRGGHYLVHSWQRPVEWLTRNMGQP